MNILCVRSGHLRARFPCRGLLVRTDKSLTLLQWRRLRPWTWQRSPCCMAMPLWLIAEAFWKQCHINWWPDCMAMVLGIGCWGFFESNVTSIGWQHFKDKKKIEFLLKNEPLHEVMLPSLYFHGCQEINLLNSSNPSPFPHPQNHIISNASK